VSLDTSDEILISYIMACDWVLWFCCLF